MNKSKKEHYLEREISWMYFNYRLLKEAQDTTVPLLERLKFLGIYSNNLDEFFRVRVALLNRIINIKDVSLRNEKKIAENILETITHLNKNYTKEFESVFDSIKKELEEKNVFILNENQISEKQKEEILSLFRTSLHSHLYPRMFSLSSNFDDISDESIYLAIKLSTAPRKKEYALLELPSKEYGRFIQLSTDKPNETIFMFLDDVIRVCLPFVFIGMKYDKYEAYTFKITKDAEIDIEPNLQGDIMEKIAQAVKNRKKGQPVRFICDATIPKDLLKQVYQSFNIGLSDNIVMGGRYHNLKDLMDFSVEKRKDLIYTKWQPLSIKEILESVSPLDLISRKDILLHYPYHNFSNYLRVLREASISKDVQSIKITLYRLAKNSSVAQTLICAAKNGKKVTAVVELLARFDEASNIYWSQKMQEAGIKVILGIEGLKIHSKLTYIKRRGGDIACINTGNFHEGNAAAYTDLTLMTANKQIVKEVNSVFNFIEKPYKTPSFKELLISPINMRSQITYMINTEIRNAKNKKEAYILCKINHIVDKEIVDKLYEASNAGVKVRLLVRGNCSIKTGIIGLSSNIEIKGIIDKYLEHSRIFIFANNGNEKYYIGSADWITRNFDSRVETLVPVYDEAIQQELKLIVEYGLKDTQKARIVTGRGNDMVVGETENKFRSQQELYNYYKEKES